MSSDRMNCRCCECQLELAQQEIERLKEALRQTIKIWEAFILCPICAGADGNHGMACNVPKWKELVAEALADAKESP